MKTDAQLGADVAAELEWTFAGRAPDIAVRVRDGVVHLSGVVAEFFEKRAAAEAVERVGGVRAIRNVIAVRSRAEAAERPVHEPAEARPDTSAHRGSYVG